MEHIGEVFTKLEEMKNELEVFLEKVVIIDEDEDDTEEVRNLFEKINEEIKYFNNDDFVGELATVLKLEEEFNNFDLEIPTMHYYDFGYFFDRKDSGSCRVMLPYELDTDDIDECVTIALANNALDEDYADNIVYVEELSEDEARDMGFPI